MFIRIFSTSTHRWDLLKVNLTMKKLSETRWSARYDACKALIDSWGIVKQTLVDISNNLNKNLLHVMKLVVYSCNESS